MQTMEIQNLVDNHECGAYKRFMRFVIQDKLRAIAFRGGSGP
jgi:hypothetical protein